MFIGVGWQAYEPMLNIELLTALHCADKRDQNDVFLFVNSSRVELGEMFRPYEWTAEGNSSIFVNTNVNVSHY